jgi:hypothetical protein
MQRRTIPSAGSTTRSPCCDSTHQQRCTHTHAQCEARAQRQKQCCGVNCVSCVRQRRKHRWNRARELVRVQPQLPDRATHSQVKFARSHASRSHSQTATLHQCKHTSPQRREAEQPRRHRARQRVRLQLQLTATQNPTNTSHRKCDMAHEKRRHRHSRQHTESADL